jgi:hypothetical protein
MILVFVNWIIIRCAQFLWFNFYWRYIRGLWWEKFILLIGCFVYFWVICEFTSLDIIKKSWFISFVGVDGSRKSWALVLLILILIVIGSIGIFINLINLIWLIFKYTIHKIIHMLLLFSFIIRQLFSWSLLLKNFFNQSPLENFIRWSLALAFALTLLNRRFYYRRKLKLYFFLLKTF